MAKGGAAKDIAEDAGIAGVMNKNGRIGKKLQRKRKENEILA